MPKSRNWQPSPKNAAVDIQPTQVTATSFEPFDFLSKPTLKVTVPFDKFMDGWSVYRGETGGVVKGDWSNRIAQPKSSNSWDAQRCALYLQLQEVGEKYYDKDLFTKLMRNTGLA